MHPKHAMKKRVTNNNMHKFISVRKWAALLVQYTRAYSLWNAEEFVVACQYPGAHDPASLIKRKQTFNITWWPMSSSKTLRVQKKCSAHWTETELHRELQGQPHTRVGRDSNQVNKPLFHGWIAITVLFSMSILQKHSIKSNNYLKAFSKPINQVNLEAKAKKRTNNLQTLYKLCNKQHDGLSCQFARYICKISLKHLN